MAERDAFRGALAFTSFRFDDELELDIETHPDARGQGLPRQSLAYDRGSPRAGRHACLVLSDTNYASVALASKLGFRPGKRRPTNRWLEGRAAEG